MSFDLSLQQAIYNQLNNVISCSVYDSPPKTPAYPYVVIGDDSSIEFDTDNTIGREFISTIHVFDNYAGKKRIKNIFGEIDSALNRVNFIVPSKHLINCNFDSTDIFLDSDGKTFHGVISFKILIDED